MVKKLPLVLGAAVVAAGCSSMQHQTAGFTDVTERSGISTVGGRSVGWADYDRNGCIDFMVTLTAGPVLYRNNCDRTFTDVTGDAAVSGPKEGVGVAWADYDADGGGGG